MLRRNAFFGLAALLAVATAATAKPPDVPTPSQVEGREPTPLAREFYEVDVPTPLPESFSILPYGSKWPVDPTPLTDFVTGVRDVVLNRLTVPLGAVPVRE